MIRSRKLWCAVDPRGRLMHQTLAETKYAATENGCHDAANCLGFFAMSEEEFEERGYRVIRVRVVEEAEPAPLTEPLDRVQRRIERGRR